MDFLSLTDEELCLYVDEPYAFAELYSRYKTLLKSRISKYSPIRSIDDDDLLQEGLLGFYLAAKSFKQEKGVAFRTYASICMENRLKNVVRNQRSAKNSLFTSSISIEDISGDIKDNVPSPEETFLEREYSTALLNQIHISLSDFERDVLALYLSGYKRSQIAESLNCTVKSYDNAIARIRAKVKAISLR